MMRQTIHTIVTPDINRHIHIEVPIDFGNNVEVILISENAKETTPMVASPESLAMIRLIEETSFVKDVVGSAEEDCWNGI